MRCLHRRGPGVPGRVCLPRQDARGFLLPSRSPEGDAGIVPPPLRSREPAPTCEAGAVAEPLQQTPSGKPRARSLGIAFDGEPGPWNAITDVPGVEVGYATLIEGSDVRTGVTGVHPRG